MVAATLRVHSLLHLRIRDVALPAYAGEEGLKKIKFEHSHENARFIVPDGEIRFLRKDLSGNKILGEMVQVKITWDDLTHLRLEKIQEG